MHNVPPQKLSKKLYHLDFSAANYFEVFSAALFEACIVKKNAGLNYRLKMRTKLGGIV